jgi:hypothetical protein
MYKPHLPAAPLAVFACACVAVALAVVSSAKVGAQGDDRHCLDNDGRYELPVGATYSDGPATWLCDPGRVGATRGGWVVVTPAPSATPITRPTPTPTMPGTTPPSSTGPARSGSSGTFGLGSQKSEAAALALVIAVVALLFFLWRRPRAELQGSLRVIGGPRYDLARLGRRASIGTAAAIPIVGQAVAARHASIFAREGEDWLKPADGDVWLERRGLSQLVTRPARLADGDVMVIGDVRVKYTNLAAAKAATGRKANMTWMR